MNETNKDIPASWLLVSLDKLGKIEWGNTSITKKSYVEKGVVAFSATGPDGFLPEAEWFGPGIVVSAIGANCGKCFYADGEWATIKNTIVFQSNEEFVLSKFLYYQLDGQRNWYISGSGQPFITLKTAREKEVVLPPLNEQKRIVAKIEELFSELESGIESLKTAREQLKIYRQAVLKHAFEGKLTAAWREKNKDKLESAEQLLKRMGTERIKQANLADLPASWAWIKSTALFSMVTSGSRGWAKYYSDNGALFIRIGNLDFDSLKLDLADIQYVSPPASAEGSRTRVQEGDFLFSITGYLGMFAIAPKLDEAYVNQHIALARPCDGFNKEYVGYYITSKTGGHYYLNGLTKGAVKAGLRLDDIRSFPVPMCSIAEQEEIVGQIKQTLSVIENLESTIEAELQKSEALRQSILKKAFSGQLVAQNPADEPASLLLERIRSEKATPKPTTKKPKEKSKAA